MKKLTVFLLTTLFLTLSMTTAAIAQRFAVTTGNWTGAIWATTAGGTAGSAATPISTDAVTINSGVVVTVNAAGAVCASITVSANATLTNGITITSPGTLAVTNAITMTSPTALTSTIDVGTGTLSAASIAIPGSATAGWYCTLSLSTGTVNVTGAITTSGTAAQSRITFTDAGTINVGGNFASGTFTASTGTVNLNGAAQTGGVLTYNNLTLSGSGVKTFATTPTVNGILSLEGTATVVVTSGVVTYGASATLQYNTTTARTSTAEEWITPFAATGGVIIASTGAITPDLAKVFNPSVPLTINSGATLLTNNLQLTFGGNFVNGGIFTAGSSNITIGNGTATQSIAGFTTTGTILMTKTGGTATFTGNVDASAGVLTINGSGGTLALGTGLTHTVNIVTLTAGTLNGGSSTLNVSGSLSATSGTFTAGTGTVNFTSSGAQTIPALTFYNLGFSGAGAKTTATGTITVGGNWDVVGGTARLYTNNSSVTVSGNITGSGNITMGSSGTITVGGSWTNNGAFDAGTGTATVNYNAAGAQTVAALTYNNLTVSGSGIKTLGGNATVTGTLTATGSVLDNAGFSLIVGPKTQWSLNEAYGLNWVEKPQTFDSVTEGFAVIEPTSTADILSWQGFFISVKQNVNVLFLADPGAAAVSSPMSKTLTNDYWYLISSPLDPGGGRDAKTNLSNSPSQLLVGDYNGNAADKWRIYKRLYTNDVYHNYADGSFEELLPGRGFWLRQKYDAGDKNVYVAGTGVSTTDGYYKMRLNFVALSANTWHQIGNPYWYTIKWSDVKFSDPLVGTEYPLGKIVADLPPDKTETCYVRLALVSSDGKAQDTYNRAGVILTEGGNPDIFSVSELTPPDPCVKLSVTDPSNTGRRALAYDYRSAGQDVYTWNVNLATTYDRTDAALSIKEFFNVPEWMGFTLTDTKTGESFALTGDKTIPVSLTKDTARTFILTAARKEIPTAADAVTPKAFGITGISPNPFNPSTTISFNLAVSGTARVSIYNLSGQLVETLVNGQMTAGSHKAVWNASRYASGVYIVVAESSGLKQSRKITLIK